MIVNQTDATYAKFTAVLGALGTPLRVFYSHNASTGFMFNAHVLFQDQSIALNVNFAASVPTATFTTDFPAAIEASVVIA